MKWNGAIYTSEDLAAHKRCLRLANAPRAELWLSRPFNDWVPKRNPSRPPRSHAGIDIDILDSPAGCPRQPWALLKKPPPLGCNEDFGFQWRRN